MKPELKLAEEIIDGKFSELFELMDGHREALTQILKNGDLKAILQAAIDADELSTRLKKAINDIAGDIGLGVTKLEITDTKTALDFLRENTFSDRHLRPVVEFIKENFPDYSTQTKLAEAIGLNQASVSRAVNPRKHPSRKSERAALRICLISLLEENQ